MKNLEEHEMEQDREHHMLMIVCNLVRLVQQFQIQI